jgi:RNA polymerase-binding transcription factor DksA
MSLPRPCRECGETIDADRRRLVPRAMNCAPCANKWRADQQAQRPRKLARAWGGRAR